MKPRNVFAGSHGKTDAGRSAITAYRTWSDSHNRENKQMDLSPDAPVDTTYTVQLKLSTEQMKSHGFLYELACRMEDWAGVEILSVQRNGYRENT